jgi:CheY-like chemotaxis protein
MAVHSILVVEDEESVRKVMQSALEREGYRVTTAANGHEASRILACEAFALVVTDLLMPDKDGIEVISELRQKQPNLPIIAMSGGGRLPREGYLIIAQHLGANAILQKPFTIEELSSMVARLLPADQA